MHAMCECKYGSVFEKRYQYPSDKYIFAIIISGTQRKHRIDFSSCSCYAHASVLIAGRSIISVIITNLIGQVNVGCLGLAISSPGIVASFLEVQVIKQDTVGLVTR